MRWGLWGLGWRWCSDDYSAVRFWDGRKDFSDNPISQMVEGYLEFLEREVEFVGRRNRRIHSLGE